MNVWVEMTAIVAQLLFFLRGEMGNGSERESKKKAGKLDFFATCNALILCYLMNGILNGKNERTIKKEEDLSVNRYKCRWQHLFAVSRIALHGDLFLPFRDLRFIKIKLCHPKWFFV